jgi:hypothetical protein
MGKADPSQLLTLADLGGPFGLLLILVALPVMLWVALRPHVFWPALIVSAIVGVGPRVKGYPLLDEVLIFAALGGALLHLVLRPQVSGPIVVKSTDRFLFMAWIVYMIAQSIVGIFATDDPRVMRWVLLYAGLGLLFLVVNFRRQFFPFPSVATVCALIMWSTVVSYVAYLGQGMYSDYTLGQYGRFLSQDMVWVGSAVAVFPTIIAIPAALLALREGTIRASVLAWITIVLSIAVAFFFQSRISWFVMAAFAPVAWRVVAPRQVAAAAVLVVVMFAVFVPNPLKNAGGFTMELVQTSQALWAPSNSDVGRTLQLKAGVLTILRDPQTFFFGTGVYGHRFAIIPTIVGLFDEFLPAQDFAIAGARNDTGLGLQIFRTTGFTALLIDTGVIGISLFTALFVLCAWRVLSSRSAAKYVLTIPLLVAFFWLLSNNILDVMLMYLMLMPGGLLHRLAEQTERDGERAAAMATPALRPSPARLAPFAVPQS